MSGSPTLRLGPWLQAVQIGDGALCVCSRLEDRSLVVGEDLQPARQVGGVVGPRFQVSDNSEITQRSVEPISATSSSRAFSE